MADSESVLSARVALGAELAALRVRAGYTQAMLASLLITSRSSIASIETGRQSASADFWQRADGLLSGDGRLVQGHAMIEAARNEQLVRDMSAAHDAVQAEVGTRRAKFQAGTLDLLSPLILGRDVTAGGPVPSAADRLTLARSDDASARILASIGEVIVVAIDRRAFLAGTPGLLLPVTGLEFTRQDLQHTVAGDVVTDGVGDWEEIVWEYGTDYMRSSAVDLLPRLQADLAALNDSLRRASTASARRDLMRAAAPLASFTAHVTANLGDLRGSRRWWRTAKQAADESGDLGTRVWIRGLEIKRALYEKCSPTFIFGLIANAEKVSSAGPVPADALQDFLSATAQALSHTGDADRAESALRRVRDNFGRMSASVTSDKDSFQGWSEHRLRFCEGYVYSNLGNYELADRAHMSALSLFTHENIREPVQIELQRSLCLVRSGDVESGVTHAQTTMAALPVEHHIRPIADLGWKVLVAVPPAERDRKPVQEFRGYLSSRVA